MMVNRIIGLMLCLLLSGGAALMPATLRADDGPVGEFREPWKDSASAIVIDTFEGNSIDWQQLATDDRVAGIIHRATKGFKKDEKYFQRRAIARKLGYKWGCYHIGMRGNPIKQADYFLKTVKPQHDELIALDLEDIDSRKFMNLAQARLFIKRIKEKTGRYPMVYGNYKVISKITAQVGQDDIFSRTPLWFARFRSDLPDFPAGTWDHYTLWQFSCEINCKPEQVEQCLYRVPGTESDMDVNVYRGSVDDLKAAWPFGK